MKTKGKKFNSLNKNNEVYKIRWISFISTTIDLKYIKVY